MGIQVCAGATAMCSFGMAPSTITILPANQVLTGTPAGNIADSIAMTNILSFGACTSMSNPTVASATSAAMGVLTPMACVPVPAGTWVPGSTKVMLKSQPALDMNATATCSYGGVITILYAGQTKVIDA